MPGPVLKDSLGRCEPSSMLYDTVRNPTAPYKPPPQPLISADTMESTQQRLNREMLSKIRGDGKILSHDSYVSVVQVGKYMFLAAMLPPYLIIYGIPHWILMNLIPQIYHFAKTQALNVGRHFQELSRNIVDLMQGLLEQLLGDSFRMMNQKSKNVWKYFKNASNSVLRQVVSVYEKLAQKVRNVQHQITRPLKKFKKRFEDAAIWVGKKIEAVAKGFYHQGNTLISNVVIPFYHFANGFAKAPLSHTLNGFRNAARSINHIAVKLTRPIVSASLVVYCKVKASALVLARFAEKVAKPFVKAAVKFKDVFNALAKRVTETYKKEVERVNAFVTPKLQGLADLAVKVSHGIVHVGYWMWGIIPQSAKNRVREFYRSSKRRGRGFKAFVGSSVSKGQKRSGGIVQGLVGLVEPVSRFWRWVLNRIAAFKSWFRRELIELPFRVGRGIVRGLEWSLQVGPRVIHGIRVLFAWVYAVVVHTFQLLSEAKSTLRLWLNS